MMDKCNVDLDVVDDFGKEWDEFNQNDVPYDELSNSFKKYFSLFPWDKLPTNSVGFDLGCGSGRWAYFVAQLVGHLHCIDPARSALDVAEYKLSRYNNCSFHNDTIDTVQLDDDSLDFGYTLGVLHHIPDTEAAIQNCVSKLKPGAPFLAYIYYAFDNRPYWFKVIWKCSDVVRRFVSRLPFKLKLLVSNVIALFVYYPLVKISLVLDYLGMDVSNIPLSSYRNQCFYSLRTDSLDRFGTKLEKRFTKDEIREMFQRCGLTDIAFRDGDPYWCVIGYKE